MAITKRTEVLVRKTIFTIAVPLAVWFVMEILTVSIVGVHVIDSRVDAISFMRNLLISFCFALGLNCNLALGRMDLSCGSQMYLACIYGGNFALFLTRSINGSAIQSLTILFFCVVVGAMAGGFVGFLFIKLRILPMILGFGVTLVFECLSFNVNNNQGLILYGKGTLLSESWFILLISGIIALIMTYMFQYSRFGYERRAIQGNQKLAHECGINIYSNAVICYVLAGALVSVSGVLTTVYETRLTPVLGMSSNSSVFSNMFPMAVGIWMARRTNPVIGIFFGAVSVQILIIGLSKFSIVGVSNYMQTCIRYTCWLVFMIYRMNENKLMLLKRKRTRIAEAKKISFAAQSF